MTTIAITGSTGHVGGLVARSLAPLPQRLVVRDASRAPALDGAEIVEASYSDAAAAVSALDGVDLLFMVSAAEAVDRRAQHRSFIAAAAAAGVKHIVYTSFFGADPEAVFTLGRDHADAELAIRESGLAFTILRDNFYSDLLPYFADDAGVIRGPAGEGSVAAVARADVADVVVAILRDPAAHENQIYELTGPESLTLHEVAARAGAALGRALTYQPETVEEARESRAHYGAEPWQMDAWVSTYTAIADGEVSRVTDDVRRITGADARTIEAAIAASS
ncbi:uncharacterized protein YbjT (DUF2867 family) [Conyzicola lurida]|uniref:Uncharacterized protein YbjT (DUF2867 family) n=1 Tax=Conyzicola lurida TaxID=1172621 RepID=A0A841AMV9_9MICO|nr:NAD(P)H-binding protein [Conyzicola lurida]MBB5843081.1 uncharacterized protein YbjT (DUF2867 family) [Conyzicola lurida]